ncbi:uncharacterized protein ACIGJ3_010252 isoform 1-T1 [Trichechus inunguis]
MCGVVCTLGGGSKGGCGSRERLVAAGPVPVAPPRGGPPSGGDYKPPRPGAGAASQSQPRRAPRAPRAEAAFPTQACRRPAPGGVNKRRARFDLARPGFLAGVPPEQKSKWKSKYTSVLDLKF